jgi:hypothetical protein
MIDYYFPQGINIHQRIDKRITICNAGEYARRHEAESFLEPSHHDHSSREGEEQKKRKENKKRRQNKRKRT